MVSHNKNAYAETQKQVSNHDELCRKIQLVFSADSLNIKADKLKELLGFIEEYSEKS